MPPTVKTIFGAPGCGKTTRLLAVLQEELKTTPPERIAYVSFTRKGTYEGVNRAKEKFGIADEQLPWFRTLHSIAFRTGDFSKHDMIGKKDYKAFSDAMGMRFTGYYTEDLFSNDDRYLFAHFLRRNNPIAAERLVADLDARVFHEVETNYARYKLEKRVVDFTDIVEAFLLRDDSIPVDVAIVDEAQDLTSLQWNMVWKAFGNCKRIYLAGDDDQAIYEWSGADVEHFLSVEGEREVLSKSWRLPPQIRAYAINVASRIRHRVLKNYAPADSDGAVYFYNDLRDLELDDSTWYFLARNNWFLGEHRHFLRDRGEVFIDKGKPSADPTHIRAINLHEKQRQGAKLTDREVLQLQRLLKPGARAMDAWYDALDIENDVVAYYRLLIKKRADVTRKNIHVDTIHGVKGGEADNVVMLCDFTRAVEANYQRNPDSELRVLYVACTRAKHNLHIVHSNSRTGYDNFIRMEDP